MTYIKELLVSLHPIVYHVT